MIAAELQAPYDVLDFRIHDRVIDRLPPKVLLLELEPDTQQERFTLPGYQVFFGISGKSLVPGTVANVTKFLSEKPAEINFDFSPLGTVSFSKTGNPDGSENKKLSAWLSYAMSPELWGPQGKWTRFHERVHALLEQQDLLNGLDYPGFYPVKARARDWKSLNVKGDIQGETLVLNLPWAWPLSGLEQFEKILSER